jgi:hypothetical protein
VAPEEMRLAAGVHRQVKAQALRHRPLVEEADGRLFTFIRLPPCQ